PAISSLFPYTTLFRSGLEALEHDPRFATNSDRLANRAALNALIEERFEDRTVDWILDRLNAAGVPCGRVRTIEEVLRDPQLAARDRKSTRLNSSHVKI